MTLHLLGHDPLFAGSRGVPLLPQGCLAQSRDSGRRPLQRQLLLHAVVEFPIPSQNAEQLHVVDSKIV